ncbi:MAG TPA: DUF485 domain-containing protein [Pseudonocardiaceae bacterium]|jgi:uncharacterized membrane protein (DUF485 family)|nr:DUF485 domain-containing protein [Pseudonocardiaceae bacterium]
MSTTERFGGADVPSPVDPWTTAQHSAEFATLRRKLRGFIFPMTAFFLAWYFLYVLLAAFAPQFMAIKVLGNINVGLLIGLLQFVTTFAITTAYVRFANKNLDPIGTRIREQIEGAAR